MIVFFGVFFGDISHICGIWPNILGCHVTHYHSADSADFVWEPITVWRVGGFRNTCVVEPAVSLISADMWPDMIN